MNRALMKVTHVFWSLGYGGIESMLVNIANEQSKMGASVSIVIINDFCVKELLCSLADQVLLVMIGRRSGSKSLSFIGRFNKELDKLQPDVIHLHDSTLYNFLNSSWRKSKSCVVCSTLHAMPDGVGGVAWSIGRLVQHMLLHQGGNVMNLNRVQHVFSISCAVARALKDEYGIASIVVKNGIYTDRFLKRERVMAKDVFKIIQVGRLVIEEKGQDLLIEAVGKLNTLGLKCHVDFIGDGKSRNMLESLSKKLGLTDLVSFCGIQSQTYLMEHLRDYDLFVQPSRNEGFGLTVAEAMSAQVPVLVSSGQGPEEVTEGERYGWVFESGNVDSLAMRIKHIYLHYALCLEKVDAAHEYVSKNYDVRITARNYLDSYRD